MKIAVLGGTGKEGSGLAYRWALKGHAVMLGSRDAAKAIVAASELNALLAGKATVQGAANVDAASGAEIIVLAVPYAAQQPTALDVKDALNGKILIDVTVPLAPPKVDRVQLPNGESAVLALQRVLGEGVKVVSAFQNVSATHLKDAAHTVDCDVLVCGDDPGAREVVIGLAHDAGMRAWHAGVLANSLAAEALTSVLIAINRQYKAKHSGIAVTGLPAEATDA